MATNRREPTDIEINEARKLKDAWLSYKQQNNGASQAWLAAMSGLGTQGAVGQYLRGAIPLNLEALLAICNVIGADPREISPRLTATVSNVIKHENPKNNVEEGPITKGLVPLISWVQAGSFSEVIDTFQPGDAEDWLFCPKKFNPGTFALRVRGISMMPKYSDGDIIYVDPSVQPEHGKNVVVRLDDEKEVTFKQLVIEDGQKFLRPLNPNWEPQLIKINGNATICGVVIGKWVGE